MNKVLKGILEFVVFVVIYFVYEIVVKAIIAIAIQFVAEIPVIGDLLFGSYAMETIMFILLPGICGFGIAVVLKAIFKTLEIGSVIAMYIVLSAIYVPETINIFAKHGLSWNAINNASALIVFCGVFAYFTFTSTKYKLSEK